MDKVTQRTAQVRKNRPAFSEEMNVQAEQMKVVISELMKVVGGDIKDKSPQSPSSKELKKGAGRHLSQVVPVQRAGGKTIKPKTDRYG